MTLGIVFPGSFIIKDNEENIWLMVWGVNAFKEKKSTKIINKLCHIVGIGVTLKLFWQN